MRFSPTLGEAERRLKAFLSENKDLAQEIREAVLTSKGLVDAKKSLESAQPVGVEA